MQMKFDKNKNILPYNDWFEYDKNKKFGKDLFLLSVNGILYPPKCMPEEAFNSNRLRSISLYNDDIWFKAMSILSGRIHRRVNSKNKKFLSILDTQQFGLNNINVTQNRNDKIIKDIFYKYNLHNYF